MNSAKKILVVDDEEGLREVLKDDLEFSGYTVYTASSGNEALEIIKTTPVDLVLSDICMADGDGVFLLKEIKKIYPGIPIVALITGFSNHTESEVLAFGAEALFNKPYDFDLLLSSIQKMLLKCDELRKVG